jgi:regulator of sigma E protease
MISVLGFLAVLGPLVVVHELGHFLFARLFNVKADIFSVGFGPTLFKKKYGETEYRISWLPLGGYVKLLGAEPEEQISSEDLPRSLNRQAPWKRFLIFLGGPLFNLIFSVFVFIFQMKDS